MGINRIMASYTGMIEDSYSIGVIIFGKDYVGGLVGENSIGKISNSYSTGFTLKSDSAKKDGWLGGCGVPSTKPRWFGGLVGYNAKGEIINSFASENIINKNNLGTAPECVDYKTYFYGNLIGQNEGTISNTFYYVSGGDIGVISGEGFIGKYTKLSNFSSSKPPMKDNWDFENLWESKQGETYPTLKQNYLGLNCDYYISNNLLGGESIDDRICTEIENACVYNLIDYEKGSRIIHNDSVYVCGEGHEWVIHHPDKDSYYDQYWIKDCLDLQSIQNDLSARYFLRNDISCDNTIQWSDGKGFIPISLFSGQLSGDGHVIDGLYINRSEEENVGLIGSVKTSTEHNLLSEMSLTNVDITGSSNVGGLLGTIVSQPKNYAYFSIKDVNVSGTVTGNSNVGGLFGFADLDTKISFTNFEGNIEGTDNVGGLIGKMTEDVIVTKSSSSINSITGSTDVGGLIGYNLGEIKWSHSSIKEIDATERVGGFVGSNERKITESYSVISGDISSSKIVGGFVGSNSGTIRSSFVSGEGKISASENVGGFVGLNDNVIKYSYVIDIFVGGSKSSFGGFVGLNDDNGEISNSFSSNLRYDIDIDASKKGYFAGENKGSLIDNSFYQDRSTYNPIGSGSGTVSLSNYASSFYNASNNPLKQWDFRNVWKQYSSTYPKLLAFPVEQCNSNDDCKNSNTYCGSEKTCIPKLSSFKDCSEDYMCESGVCGSEEISNYENICIPDVPDCTGGYFESNLQVCVICTDDIQCGENSYCEDYKCVDGCTVDTDCESDQFCLSGRCKEKIKTGDKGCNGDEQCLEGICSDGECVECTTNDLSNCAQDGTQYCSNDVCTDYKQLLDDCTNNEECGPGQFCNDYNYCGSYYREKTCASDKLLFWNPNELYQTANVEFPICVQCIDDGDCLPGDVCNSRKLCVDQCDSLGLSETCGDKMYCNGSQCVDRLESGTFFETEKTELDGSFVCLSSLSQNSQGGQDVQMCVDCISTNTDYCSSNEFCNSNKECQGLLSGGESCTDGSQCLSNNCRGSLFGIFEGTCAVCIDDGECETGKFCNSNFECEYEKINFEDCSRNEECSLGYCSPNLGYCTYSESNNPLYQNAFDARVCESLDLRFVSLPEEDVCVECSSSLDCSGGKFCSPDYRCLDDSYIKEKVILSEIVNVANAPKKNQLVFEISDSLINIVNTINSDFETAVQGNIVNLTLKETDSTILYNENSTIERTTDSYYTLSTTTPLRLNISYNNEYFTVVEFPIDFILECGTIQNFQYNFTYLDNQTQSQITYYCYDGEFCGGGRSCAIITSPSGESQDYQTSINLDFLKYVNSENSEYYWFSDRLAGFPTAKKNVSEASVLTVNLDILGPIKLGLNVDNSLDEIDFISSTQNPSCYIDEDNKAYWVYNKSADLVKYFDIEATVYKGSASCYFGNVLTYGYCCPKGYKPGEVGTELGKCVPDDTYSASSVTEGSTCSQITAAENCNLVEWDSSFDISDLDISKCGVPVNTTFSDGTNRTVRYNCDCVWDSSTGECATSYTTESITYCLADSDCDVSKYCSTEGICEDIEDYCTDDENCSSWQFCNTNESLCENQEDYCYSINSYCPDGKVCIDHLCDYCSEDDDCKSGYYCSTSGQNNYCVVIPSGNNEETPTYNNYNTKNTGTTNTGNSSSGSTSSDSLKWLWIIPTVIFLGVIVLIIFILKKHNVKKNKFDTDDYKKSSKLPPTPPTSPFSQFSAPQQNLIRAPPARSMSQQFPPRMPPTNLSSQRPQNPKQSNSLFGKSKESSKN